MEVTSEITSCGLIIIGPTTPARRRVYYKNPLDIRVPHTLDYLGKYFPKTLPVIGLRHPVDWFQSMCTISKYKIYRHTCTHPSVWGDPNTLIDKCIHWTEMDRVGTAKAWFHVYLATLGKVSFPDSWKVEYPLYLNATRQTTTITRTLPNAIILYETRQLKSLIQSSSKSSSNHDVENTTRTNNSLAKQFRNDLAKLLDLENGGGTTNNSNPSSSVSTRQQRRVAFQHAMILIKPDMTSFSKRVLKN